MHIFKIYHFNLYFFPLQYLAFTQSNKTLDLSNKRRRNLLKQLKFYIFIIMIKQNTENREYVLQQKYYLEL